MRIVVVGVIVIINANSMMGELSLKNAVKRSGNLYINKGNK
jgi:hypothetical protein